MDFTTDNATIAWSHWLAQFADSPRLESVVKAMYQGMDSAAVAAASLYFDRQLDTARGAQLDGIGEIVGQDREILAGSVPWFGFEGQTNSAGFNGARFRREGEEQGTGTVALLDAEYRQLIRWKIAINKGSGTARDVAEALNAIFDTDGTQVKDLGNAKASIWVNAVMEAGNPLLVNKERWIPTAAGVGVTFVGFQQTGPLLTESGDDLLTESGDQLIYEYFQEGL